MRCGVAIAITLWLVTMLPACGAAPIEGAWEGKVSNPQGSDPSGYEIHLTLTRFLKGEPAGAIEYTVFHPTQEMDPCSGTLEAVSKSGGIYDYEESITRGKCETGMTIRVTSAGEEGLNFQRIDGSGEVTMQAALAVQTGVATAKDRPGG